MKTKEFVQTLRKIIQEEVRSAVQTEFKRYESVLTESKNVNRSYQEEFKPISRKKSKPQQFSKNYMLNEILNETAGFGNNQGEFDEWPTMNMNSLMGSKVQPATIVDIEGRPATNIPEELVTNLTKDYSALMKAIDKKKGVS
jgi:hypothetical protein